MTFQIEQEKSFVHAMTKCERASTFVIYQAILNEEEITISKIKLVGVENRLLKPPKMKTMNRGDFFKLHRLGTCIHDCPEKCAWRSRFCWPSDKVNLGLIEVGMQQMGELLRLILDERLQIASVCDPNK